MVSTEVDVDRLSTMLRALGHPARLELIRTMAEGDASCMDLTRHVDLAQSTVSEHLRVLREAGIIRQCGPGFRSGYCLNREALLWLKQNVIAL